MHESPTPRSRRRTPFGVLEDTFDVLVAPPKPLALDGTQVDGLPDRAVPLDELRAMLLHPATPYETRDAALDVLVTRAQHDGGRHLIGLAGCLLPGLRRGATTLVEASSGQAADIEAEMLTGLMAAVQVAVPGRSRPAARLIWAAWRSAANMVRRELAERGRPAPTPVGCEPPPEAWPEPPGSALGQLDSHVEAEVTLDPEGERRACAVAARPGRSRPATRDGGQEPFVLAEQPVRIDESDLVEGHAATLPKQTYVRNWIFFPGLRSAPSGATMRAWTVPSSPMASRS
jgi:hypothetical protein